MADDWGAALKAQSWDAHHHLHQRILNARPIPPSAAQHRLPAPVLVTAWVVWERDGLELIETTATHWAGRDVLVELGHDHRSRFLGTWLSVQDARKH